MKNNQGILNLTEKKIYFKFNDEDFVMDLTEGDLPDNWNAFQTKDGVERDLNFTWDGYSEKDKPYFTVYGLTKDEGDNEFWSTNWDDRTSIKLIQVIGTEGEYFGIPFTSTTKLTFEVADKDGNIVLKTKRLNRASDETVGNDYTVTAIDVYGNRKHLTPQKKEHWFEIFTSDDEDGTETIHSVDIEQEAIDYIAERPNDKLQYDKWTMNEDGTPGKV